MTKIVARLYTFDDAMKDALIHKLPVYRTFRDRAAANKWITKQVAAGYWRAVEDTTIFGMHLAASNGACLVFTL